MNTAGLEIQSEIAKALDSNMYTIMTCLDLSSAFNIVNVNLLIFNKSNYKIRRNLLVHRFKTLNNKIDYSWLNDSFESFKIKCKTLLL